MTNKKAYEILKNSECFGAVELYKKDEVEAFNVALEALKAEPCDDTINRKHLLSEIDNLMKSPWFNQYKDTSGVLHFGYAERKEAVEMVQDLCVKTEPPVTLKPKTGKWIDCNDDYGWLKCSLCSYGSEGELTSDGGVIFNYCPNCGAKMEGESE